MKKILKIIIILMLELFGVLMVSMGYVLYENFKSMPEEWKSTNGGT